VGKRGHKSRRGQGERYDEPKSVRKVIVLTPTGALILKLIAQIKGESFSETIEQMLRQSGYDHGVIAQAEKKEG
jgi:hypothetical protein